MRSDEFEQLLHPVFLEDEWILISLGGVLGLVVGFVQFSGGTDGKSWAEGGV